MSIIDQVARQLDVLGVGTYDPGGAGGTVYLIRLPDAPDVAVAVARYPGGASSARFGEDAALIQLRCRGSATDARDGEALAQAVYDALHGYGPATLPDGTRVRLVTGTTGGPAYMGTDSRGRPEWAVNTEWALRRVTAHRQ